MQVIIEPSLAEVNVSCALYQDLWNYTTNACGFLFSWYTKLYFSALDHWSKSCRG